MAAVLCNGIGSLCTGACTGLGNCCHSIGDLCEGSCSVIGKVLCLPCRLCGMTCEAISDAICSPFFPFLAVTLVFNIPSVVFGIDACLVDDGDGECGDSLTWILVNAILCVANIVAAFYIVKMIQAERKSHQQNSEGLGYVETTAVSNSDTKKRSLARVSDVLCNDPGVAVYILVGIFYLIWQALGTTKLAAARLNGENVAVCVHLAHAILSNYCFICLGGLAFTVSICCSSAQNMINKKTKYDVESGKPAYGASSSKQSTPGVAVATAAAVASLKNPIASPQNSSSPSKKSSAVAGFASAISAAVMKKPEPKPAYATAVY